MILLIDKFMTKKKVLTLAIGMTILSLVIDPYLLGLCTNSDNYCYFGSLAHSFGKPLFYIFSSLLIVSTITLFIKDNIFYSWSKFARIWIPASVFIFLITPEYSNSLLPIEKDTISLSLSFLFIIISIIVIVSKSLSLRKN